MSGASDVSVQNVQSDVLHVHVGHHRGAESVSGATCACDLCPNVRGGQSVGGVVIVLGPWMLWFGCLVGEV